MNKISLGVANSIMLLEKYFERHRTIMELRFAEHRETIETKLEDLEKRHNIITDGTEFGRVLALRDFTNTDLTEGDAWFKENCNTENYCVLSTLNLDRAEELLTSEKYMSFLVDVTLPTPGYFRLVLARRPKHWEGLSAFGAISHKLGYHTAILPLDCWRHVMKVALEKVLDPDDYKGVEQLIERNTELGVKDCTLDTLLADTPEGLEYCGRIEKLPQEKKKDESTITTFLKNDLPIPSNITKASVLAYVRLLSLLYRDHKMSSYDTEALKERFRGSYFNDLRRSILSTFGQSNGA